MSGNRAERRTAKGKLLVALGKIAMLEAKLKFLEEEKKGNKTLEDKNNPFKDRVSTTLSVAYRAKEGDVINGRTQDRLDQDGNIIPNYPKRPGIKFTIESSMGVAIDQYGEKYRLME